MKKSILLPIITIALAAAILLGLSFGLNGLPMPMPRRSTCRP